MTGRLDVAQDTLRLVALLSIGVFCVVIPGRGPAREEHLVRLAEEDDLPQRKGEGAPTPGGREAAESLESPLAADSESGTDVAPAGPLAAGQAHGSPLA